MRAVAAICLSSGFSGWGTRSRPHTLRGVRVKRQDIFAVFGQEFAKPALESLGLPGYGKFAETPVSNQVENALNKWILIASAVCARPAPAVFGCFGNLAGARLRVAQRCRGAAAIR